MSGAPLHDYDGDFSNLRTLPEGWEWSTLEDITDNHDGQRVPVKVDDRAKRSGPYPYYGASGIIDDIDDFIFDGEYLLIAEDGANLLSRRTPVAFKAKGKFWVNNHAHVVTTREPIPLGYLEHYIEATNLQFFCTGTAQPKLNQKNLNRIPVPIAPPEEQKRIVSKIEELFSDLDAGVSALERARANLRRYRASVLKSAVEGRLTQKWRSANPDVEPASELLAHILRERRQRWEQQQLATYESKGKKPAKNWQSKYKEPAAPDTANLPQLPNGWCWATVDQLTYYLRNGLSKKPSQTPPGHRILRINAVRPMSLDQNEVRYYEHEGVDDFFIEPDDLLFTRYNGSVDLLGVCALVPTLEHPTLHPDKLIRLKTVVRGPLPAYVEIAANVGVSRKHMSGRARTTAGQTGISGGDVKEMPIPFCPTKEQTQIVTLAAEQLEAVSRANDFLVANESRTSRLRHAILKSAFKGRLVRNA